ncbi:MAG: phenylacetate--CoA ligase family protein, partial [Candidatus Binatia bacterium]
MPAVEDPAAIRAEWLATIERSWTARRGPDSAAFWARSLETMSRDELAALQSEKLRVAVRYANACIAFYRRKFAAIGLEPGDVRGIEDLGKLPLTTKQEMAEDLAAAPPWGTYTAVDDARWLESGWQIFASSGTTAQPRAFRYTQFDRELWAWADARAMWAMGFRPGRDAALIAFGYGPHVWLWGVHNAFQLMGIPIVTAGGLDSRTRVRFIERYRPTILCCT